MTEHNTAHSLWENQYLADTIAFLDPSSYKSMLAIPAFARRWRGESAQSQAQSKLIIKVKFVDRVEYRLCGKLHNLYDKPASICVNGDKAWYREGKFHRDGMPAIITAKGDQYWYQNGRRHRDRDLPAVISANGDQYWYQYGKKHRDGHQPAVIYADGEKYWYQHDKLHRDDDLPAVIYADGDPYWYHYGMSYNVSRKNRKKWQSIQMLSR